jgi:hypothetical protein
MLLQAVTPHYRYLGFIPFLADLLSTHPEIGSLGPILTLSMCSLHKRQQPRSLTGECEKKGHTKFEYYKASAIAPNSKIYPIRTLNLVLRIISSSCSSINILQRSLNSPSSRSWIY